jgi:arabinogalactan oligomer/maltooligosaccharide transport system substrate-binding protein
MDKMTAEFQALHPEWNITFTQEIVGEDVARDEVLKDVAAAGDVFFFANDQMEQLVGAGALARLGGAAEALVKDTMSETVANTVVKDGATYGIPFTHNTFFMFYDKSLLDENDIKSMEGIMGKDTGDNVYNFYFDAGGGWKSGAYYYGAGLTIYGEDQITYAEGSNWNNETGIAVTNYLIDLINNPKCVWIDDAKAEELFAEHRLGAHFDGAWNYNLYKEALGDDLGVAVLPTFNPDGNDYQLKGFYGSKAIGVNAQSKFAEQAVAFATFLGGKDMQVLRFVDSAQIPTNIEAGETPEVTADEVAVVIMKEADIASVIQPTNQEFGSRYWTAAGALITDIHSGDLNKDNVQEKMDAFVNAMKVE